MLLLSLACLVATACRFVLTCVCILIQDLGHKNPHLQSCYWCERGLWLVPGKSGGRIGRAHGMCWGWSTEKGEKLETKIAAVLGEWSVLCLNWTALCTGDHIHFHAISNGSSFLISIAMIKLCLAVTNKETLWFLLEGIVKLWKPNILLHGDWGDSAGLWLGVDDANLPLAWFIVYAEVHKGDNYNQYTLVIRNEALFVLLVISVHLLHLLGFWKTNSLCLVECPPKTHAALRIAPLILVYLIAFQTLQTVWVGFFFLSEPRFPFAHASWKQWITAGICRRRENNCWCTDSACCRS